MNTYEVYFPGTKGWIRQNYEGLPLKAIAGTIVMRSDRGRYLVWETDSWREVHAQQWWALYRDGENK